MGQGICRLTMELPAPGMGNGSQYSVTNRAAREGRALRSLLQPVFTQQQGDGSVHFIAGCTLGKPLGPGDGAIHCDAFYPVAGLWVHAVQAGLQVGNASLHVGQVFDVSHQFQTTPCMNTHQSDEKGLFDKGVDASGSTCGPFLQRLRETLGRDAAREGEIDQFLDALNVQGRQAHSMMVERSSCTCR